MTPAAKTAGDLGYSGLWCLGRDVDQGAGAALGGGGSTREGGLSTGMLTALSQSVQHATELVLVRIVLGRQGKRQAQSGPDHFVNGRARRSPGGRDIGVWLNMMGQGRAHLHGLTCVKLNWPGATWFLFVTLETTLSTITRM